MDLQGMVYTVSIIDLVLEIKDYVQILVLAIKDYVQIWFLPLELVML